MNFVLFTPSLAGGGAEKAMLKIAAGLRDRGHEVLFVVCERGGSYPPPSGCTFYSLGRRAGHGWLAKRRLARRLKRLLERWPYDVFVSTLPFADEIAALARVSPHVCRIANTLSVEVGRLSGRKRSRRFRRYQALYADRPLVAVSEGVAEDLSTSFGIDRSRVRVIPNPFDFEAVREQARTPLDAAPARPYILHVGRYAAQKRHDLLFAAFARLVAEGLPHQLVLLAPGSAALDAVIRSHGLESRVTVAGFQLNPYPWMAHAELVVLCSDHEGFPNVLVEALACGTRVVSTDCPSGPREILSGILAKGLVPCGDAARLAEAIRETLTEPRPAASVVNRVLARYDKSRIISAWETLGTEVMGTQSCVASS